MVRYESMGLLDKAKAELNNYIQFDIFVFYLAYFTDETLSDVTDWLSYHQDIITEKLSEYDVYDDYRVEDNFDYNNSYFLNAISKLVKWGFFDDEFDKFDGEIDRDELFDFYYDIRELNEFSIFKELDINFYNALDLKFIVTESTDKVTVSDKSPYRKINGVEIVSRVRYVFDGLQSKTSQSEVNPSAINENIQLGVSKYLDHIYQKAQNYHEQYFDENKDTLQVQLDQAHARITELENIIGQLDDKELTANSKNSVSKLLYALMENGDFQLDGTKKGNLNDRLVSLTKEKGVPVTEKFIADWLEYLNDKYYFKKGK